MSERPSHGSAKMLRPEPAGTIAPEVSGRSSWRRRMCVPRLGRMTGTSASGRSSCGRRRSAHTPVALTMLSPRTTNASPPSAAVTRTPPAKPPSSPRPRPPTPFPPPPPPRPRARVRPPRAEASGLLEHGEEEPHVVRLAVEEQVAGARLAAGQRGQVREDLLPGDDAMAVGAPVLLLPAPAPAGGRPRHHVVHVQPDAHEPVEP